MGKLGMVKIAKEKTYHRQPMSWLANWDLLSNCAVQRDRIKVKRDEILMLILNSYLYRVSRKNGYLFKTSISTDR